MEANPWILRPAIVENKSERGFIIKTWLDTLRGFRDTHDISNDVFYWHYHLLLEKLWERPGATWIVAADPQDPAIIYGYLCGEITDQGPMLHWSFVKSRFRGRGVCRDLLRELISRSPEGPLVFTHMTRNFRDKFSRQNPWIYNPYALYYGLETGWQKGASNGKKTGEHISAQLDETRAVSERSDEQELGSERQPESGV